MAIAHREGIQIRIRDRRENASSSSSSGRCYCGPGSNIKVIEPVLYPVVQRSMDFPPRPCPPSCSQMTHGNGRASGLSVPARGTTARASVFQFKPRRRRRCWQRPSSGSPLLNPFERPKMKLASSSSSWSWWRRRHSRRRHRSFCSGGGGGGQEKLPSQILARPGEQARI